MSDAYNNHNQKEADGHDVTGERTVLQRHFTSPNHATIRIETVSSGKPSKVLSCCNLPSALKKTTLRHRDWTDREARGLAREEEGEGGSNAGRGGKTACVRLR